MLRKFLVLFQLKEISVFPSACKATGYWDHFQFVDPGITWVSEHCVFFQCSDYILSRSFYRSIEQTS